ncbi:MAG: hypothetical protein PUC29_08620, partial [Clostridia bacterium]|nr:hypothetical protein [Clostridia bacterium]
MKTKILAVLLACLFAFPLLSVEVFADYSTVSVGDFEFILFPGTKTASVTKYTGESTTVIIPAYVNGYSVVSA